MNTQNNQESGNGADNVNINFDPSLYGDASSVNEITEIMSEDRGDLLDDDDLRLEVEYFLESRAINESTPVRDRLTIGLNLLGRFFSQTNTRDHAVGGLFCQYAIEQGRILIHLKVWVQSLDLKWELWAADHLKFMGERTRQQYMLMAKRTDVWPYAFLGKERLLLLISATRHTEGEDPAGTLLREFNLIPDPTSEYSISSFKADVDAALAVVRARKAGVNVDYGKIRKLVEIGTEPDSRMIRDMAVIQKNGGSVDKYLDRRFMDQGEDDTDLLDPQMRIEHFVKLSSRIRSTINVILKHSDLASKIDREQVETLEAKVAELKAFIKTN